MQENDLAKAEQEGIIKKFKLESSLTLSSMVLFDSSGVLRKYDTAEDIMREFFETRLKKYRERKEYLKGMLEAEASKLENQARFILEKIEGKITIGMLKIPFDYLTNDCAYRMFNEKFYVVFMEACRTLQNDENRLLQIFQDFCFFL